MNVSLTPELERLVEDRVASGKYASASEVVRAALRLLDERDRAYEAKLDALRRDLQVGREQMERGELIPAEDVVARLRREGRRVAG